MERIWNNYLGWLALSHLIQSKKFLRDMANEGYKLKELEYPNPGASMFKIIWSNQIIDLDKLIRRNKKKMYNKNPISVNLHFWPCCNMNCRYCFAKFSHIRNPLSKKDWFQIILLLADYGMKKVNFVGGEPTLCPFLGELIIFSNKLGLITGVASNGIGITQPFLG